MVPQQQTKTAKGESADRNKIPVAAPAASNMLSLSAVPSLDSPGEYSLPFRRVGGRKEDSSEHAHGKNDVPTVRVNVQYRNDSGRSLVLSRSLEVHYDFGQLNSTLNVTISVANLPVLADDPNIEYCGGDGAVLHCYTDRSSRG